jgi:hypothetical protein
MKKIEEILEKKYTEDQYKEILSKNVMDLIKEAFIAGYQECLRDREKILG